MKESRRIELQEKLDEAYAREDNAAVDAIRRTIDREVMECTAHTAERVKRIEEKQSEIKDLVMDIHDKFREQTVEAKGVSKGKSIMLKFVIELAKVLGVGGSFAGALEAIRHFNAV